MSSPDAMKHPCPCCGYLTLSEPKRGSFEICPVCYWEDDRVQFEEPDERVGANAVSLNDARRNFKEYGAVSERNRAFVRPPEPGEIPPEPV